ncbi:MAG: prepilin peptidase [Candidatus Aenigmarchaeota archaeon]|nr:prepilin peptidase [Candidatus Aenigmarchaeota archaeon]
MLGIILLLIGIGGFGLAAYLDLRTTEFPDWLPYSMIILALAARGGYAYFLNDISIILQSLVVGAAFLGLGLLMYFTRQWGDGDAWLLGALGFLFPEPAGFVQAGLLPFPAVMILNFFFTSFVYVVAYAMVLGLRERKASAVFLKELKGDSKVIFSTAGLLILLYAGFVFYLSAYMGLAVPSSYMITLPLLIIFIVIFMRYGRFVEANLFKRLVPASKLKPGDVLADDRWKGLTEKGIKELQKKGGKVWVKEGVRFAPVFLITMLVTLFYGSVIMLFL